MIVMNKGIDEIIKMNVISLLSYFTKQDQTAMRTDCSVAGFQNSLVWIFAQFGNIGHRGGAQFA